MVARRAAQVLDAEEPDVIERAGIRTVDVPDAVGLRPDQDVVARPAVDLDTDGDAQERKRVGAAQALDLKAGDTHRRVAISLGDGAKGHIEDRAAVRRNGNLLDDEVVGRVGELQRERRYRQPQRIGGQQETRLQRLEQDRFSERRRGEPGSWVARDQIAERATNERTNRTCQAHRASPRGR